MFRSAHRSFGRGAIHMKIGYGAALLLLVATPALSGATKTENGVLLECKLTGSGDSGFDITGDNKQGSADRNCSASCKLTKSDGSTFERSYSHKINKGFKTWMGGEAGVSGAPLKNPDLTKGSCT
jgi:hypothetical protein